MNKPVATGDLLDALPADDAGGESLQNPNAKSGVFVDHRDEGGPLLCIPEATLRHVDRIGAEMRREDALFDPSPEAVEQAVEKMAAVGATARQIAVFAGLSVQAKEEAKTSPAQEFDWTEDESVVVSEQSAVAIYFNQKGELVIRQEKSWCDDDDHFVVVAARNVADFIDKLCDIAGVPGVP